MPATNRPATLVGTVLLPGGSLQRAAVRVADGRIDAVELEPSEELVRALARDRAAVRLPAGDVLAPAFVDVHCHGAGGGSAHGDVASLRRMASTLGAHGIGAFLATTMTAPLPALRAAAGEVARVQATQQTAGEASTQQAAAQAAARSAPSRQAGEDALQAQLLGMHLEGPVLAPARSAGHDQSALLSPQRLGRALAAAPGDWQVVRVVTLAPELEGGLQLVRRLAAAGIAASLGHTDADDTAMTAAYAAGARSTTHLFNGMPPLHHRSPGPVGAALAAAPFIELLCDGIHVADPLLAPLARAIGEERLILVSDALPLAGSRLRRISLPGIDVHVEGQRAVDADGNLAGSRTLLDGMVANAVRQGIPLATALRAATENPARMLRLADRGVIEVGAVADLVIVSSHGRLERVLAGSRS